MLEFEKIGGYSYCAQHNGNEISLFKTYGAGNWILCINGVRHDLDAKMLRRAVPMANEIYNKLN